MKRWRRFFENNFLTKTRAGIQPALVFYFFLICFASFLALLFTLPLGFFRPSPCKAVKMIAEIFLVDFPFVILFFFFIWNEI
jgi:hypothetical protein